MERMNVERIALSVVIPAYNEEKRLLPTLEATVRYLETQTQRYATYEILVVDDGSTDATMQVAQDWIIAQDVADRVSVIGYGANHGKGYAVRFGILRANGERILFMDADLATPIAEIEKLEAAMEAGNIQFAIGSRPLPKSELLTRQPLYRELLGKGFNKLVQLMATPGIQDTQCGFKLLTYLAAKDIFSRCMMDGFSFDIEALYIARRLGYGIAEVPVRWAHQEGAAAFATKMDYLRQGLRMVADLRRIRRVHRSLVAGSASPLLSNTMRDTHHPV